MIRRATIVYFGMGACALGVLAMIADAAGARDTVQSLHAGAWTSAGIAWTVLLWRSR